MQQSLFLWDEGMKVDPGCSCRRGHVQHGSVPTLPPYHQLSDPSWG